eukprot:gene11164-9734_t
MARVLLAVTATMAPAVAAAPTNDTLKEYLFAISDWIMTLGVGRNDINKSACSSSGDIFINGNLARWGRSGLSLPPSLPSPLCQLACARVLL